MVLLTWPLVSFTLHHPPFSWNPNTMPVHSPLLLFRNSKPMKTYQRKPSKNKKEENIRNHQNPPRTANTRKTPLKKKKWKRQNLLTAAPSVFLVQAARSLTIVHPGGPSSPSGWPRAPSWRSPTRRQVGREWESREQRKTYLGIFLGGELR